MKQKNIDPKARRKREAVFSVVIFSALQIAFALAVGSLCLLPGIPVWVSRICIALAALSLLLVVPAARLLKTRFQESEGGDLDEAGKY